MLPWLATAFTTGLISSLHCVGMCGPLVAALPVGRLPFQQRWQGVALYHLSRLLTYSLLGAVAGTLSLGINLLGWQRPLSFLVGVLLLISLATRENLFSLPRWPWFDKLINRTFRRYAHQPGLLSFSALGVINGLLPCGFTYLALTGTLATDTPLAGFTYMFLFGIGTLPALLGINLVTNWLSVGRQYLRPLFSLMTIVAAVLLIGRSLSNYQPRVRPADVIPLCYGLLTK